ncbi:MAG: hypothetical protein LBF38_12475 [Deltaproteobacteria bacterium]|jgi:hypothetical protein|nr:hypothetical protein [Deltaproteobacteria bacterium]
MNKFLAFMSLLSLLLAALIVPGCGRNRSDYDRQREIRTEFLSQLTEIRQANEIIGRNIDSTYQEISILRTRLDQMALENQSVAAPTQ